MGGIFLPPTFWRHFVNLEKKPLLCRFRELWPIWWCWSSHCKTLIEDPRLCVYFPIILVLKRFLLHVLFLQWWCSIANLKYVAQKSMPSWLVRLNPHLIAKNRDWSSTHYFTPPISRNLLLKWVWVNKLTTLVSINPYVDWWGGQGLWCFFGKASISKVRKVFRHHLHTVATVMAIYISDYKWL